MKMPKFIFPFAVTILVCSCSDDDDAMTPPPVVGNCATVCEYTIGAGETAGMVPASLHGVLNLTVDFATPQSPFPVGTAATFTVSATEMTVEIDGQPCITLRNPIESGTVEKTFIDDCRDDYIYGISADQQGNLNEINLGTTSFQFLAQFK
jgi:hypothetical protein